MKISYALYELQPKTQVGKKTPPPARQGALLKIQWTEEKIGYADLHPWPEFGDLDLEAQLSELRNLRMTPLVEQAIWLASMDAQGRLEKRNTYDNQVLLKNNAILPFIDPHTVELLDPLVKQGYTKVKLKLGRHFDEEIQMINRLALTHNLKLRLDFNSRLSWNTFSQFILGLSPAAKKMIEYIEDPFPYEEAHWREARQMIPLAIDWELKKIPYDTTKAVEADVMVVKPTHQDVMKRMDQAKSWNKTLVVTSHMGHPLGVMQCMQVAQDLQKSHPNYVLEPGCMTFDLYEPTEFNSLLNLQGPFVKKVGGWGIGFDFVLKGQKWNQLKIR